MSGNCFALVANKAYLAGMQKALVSESLGQSLLFCSFEDVREHLGKETDGLLLMVAGTQADLEPIVHLIQDSNSRPLSFLWTGRWFQPCLS
jgi:hypothetical protein